MTHWKRDADALGIDTSDRVLGSDTAVAIGRFSPDGVSGYRAKYGGPLRKTRAEAEADQLRHLEHEGGS